MQTFLLNSAAVLRALLILSTTLVLLGPPLGGQTLSPPVLNMTQALKPVEYAQCGYATCLVLENVSDKEILSVTYTPLTP
jgi:hypothetical protein